LLWVRWRLGALLPRYKLDVFWAPNTLVPKGMDAVAPYIATVHDFRHVFYPSDLPPLTRFAHRQWFDSCLRNAAAIIANSHGTSQRMAELIGRSADLVVLPVMGKLQNVETLEDAKRTVESLGARRPFVMTVGRTRCKNINRVIDAISYLKSKNRMSDLQLVLVGAKQWGEQRAVTRKLRKYRWILDLGRVDDLTLTSLYSCTEALVFPSIYEGFGMPVHEALSAGARVVATDSIELREAGGDGALYVSPTIHGIASGIEAAMKLTKPLAGETLGRGIDAGRAVADLIIRVGRSAKDAAVEPSNAAKSTAR